MKSIIIPNSVISIGEFAFFGCSNLTSIILPNSITKIGQCAFSYCSNLTSITIPNSIISIGDDAFRDCGLINVDKDNKYFSSENGILFNKDKSELIYYPNMKKENSYIIPNSVKTIKNNAFENCSNLTNITIPNSVTNIGEYSFANCDNLVNITIPNSVKSIGDYAFSGCSNLRSIIMPNLLTSIANGLFNRCSNLTSIEIPNSVTNIGYDAFLECSNLTSVTIPNSVTKIEQRAFAHCNNLIKIDIPNSVTRIGYEAFSDCSNLRSITMPNLLTSIENDLFNRCSNLTNIEIPNSVKSIGYNAFLECSNLRSIIIPNSVTKIEQRAFAYCDNLTNIEIPNSVTNIGFMAFGGCDNLTIHAYKNSYAETYAKDNAIPFKELTIQNLNIESFKTDKTSPQEVGTSVKLIVGVNGATGTVQYKFYRYLNGNYATIKEWSTSNSVTITPSTTGTYDLWVAVKDSKGTMVKKNIKFTFDKALGINSFTADKVSPQYVGTSVKLTAQAVGGKGTKQYKYYRYLNGSYKDIKDWSTINNVTITPSTAGTYDLWVAVKDETGKVVKKNINFSFNKNLEINNLTTDKVSPQYVESSINITAKASGGIGTLQYRFRVGNPDGTYSIIKDYSTSNTATWKANYIGSKILYVDVKDSRGKIVTKSINYTIKAKPLEINSFTTDKSSPQYKGSSIKMTASASGGEGTLQYRFRAGNPDGSYSVVKDYSTTNTVVWTANYSGSKILYVDVKDSKGNVVTKSINYSIKEKPVINSFTTDKNSPQNLGTTIKLTANVSGGANLQYKFSVQGEDGNTITLRDYSSSNTYNWTPSTDGNQTLYVDVKDSLGVTLRKSISYNIIFVCKVNTEDFRKAVGDEMYRLVNEHRNNNGVASFTVDSVMEECAYDKSKHMSDNKYFAHEYNGKLWWDMYPEKYANWSNLGENIVLSYTDPNKVYTREECKEIAEDLFTLWKNSPGHNANMLNASFKQIGFGLYVNSSGSVFGTQEFITRFK